MGLREACQYKTIQEPPVQSRTQLVVELLEQHLIHFGTLLFNIQWTWPWSNIAGYEDLIEI